MALFKKIELENGVIINYHRIASLDKITNISNTIEVCSYTNEFQREKEREYQNVQIKNNNGEELTENEKELLNKGINVYIETEFLQLPYDENMTIEDAYEYLKETEKFSGSRDI